ncbi:MAG: D-2-hydroxyacid dehydrogenase [Clostridia bacterium]|nr:D-2-hydroxyacid dehydrogenase [Clostridia bacterium]
MKIVVLPPVDDGHKKILESACEDAQFIYSDLERVNEEMVHDADVIFGNVPFELLKKTEKLKLLQLAAAGTDGYIQTLPKGAVLANVTGAFGLAIGEHMLGVTLMLMKRLHQYRDNQLKHDWRDMGNVNSIEGATVLVLGMGDIGGSYAKKMKALGAYIIGVRRKDLTKPEYADELYLSSDIDSLLPRADIVAMAMPSMKETYRLMDARRLALLKDGAILVNVGRGNAIDTEALADACENGRISAAIDVTDPEPLPSDHRLWGMESVVITPHISGFFHLKKTLDNEVDIAAYNICALAKGEPFRNLVDMETGYLKK